MKHLISLKDWSSEDIFGVLDLAAKVKAAPEQFADALKRKTLLMIFEKPSLRTRISFETGMFQLGGHGIYYDMSTSPMGGGKETIEDSIKVISRMCDIVMARLFKHSDILEMAEHASVPVINALTDNSHPCQILADLQTIREKKGDLKGLTLAYLGDGFNNVTHSLMFGCVKTGMNVRVGSPVGHMPDDRVTEDCQQIAAESGSNLLVTNDASEAVAGADVVYTDSWMSYHIPKEEEEERIKVFTPYQVTAETMALAAEHAIFMNCLPALRGCEQTAEVIDGPQSVVFDEAENRLHAQKAVMLRLCGAA
ncbi:ornithine carbamoyltransferase [Tichowtungia aerotolerans]|uniref:Ornithine carbamoyltransferase n=1 Tax=Tichowtungia aerotolerans TaxID=2697043 RepID=A0A6P1MEE1_9BACT|nr:ornithine carbamoyltransferase [Tichowtungia aerotolerans]QHI70418.1 ornithine carbamoyltransferase [Tichowtungia aerotolerans]